MRVDLRKACSVAACFGEARYSTEPPFSPDERYPEYPFADCAASKVGNPAYGLVRDALAASELDSAHHGTAAWNPLGAVVSPGDTVVLKPNFVRDFRETVADHGDCLITHGSIIRAALDYVYIALQGKGRLVVADSPQNDADFSAIRRIAALDEIQEFYGRYSGLEVEVYDLRPERASKIDGVIVGHERLCGDPAGYATVNLGRHSAFTEIHGLCHLLYGSEYDTRELRRHQHDDVHEYKVSRTVLAADCVLGLPKLKTHKKVGLTVNMKNLVGINGNKNWLAHHREGTPCRGGDQFPDDRLVHSIEQVAVSAFKRGFPFLGRLRPVVAGPVKALGNRVFGETNGQTIRSGNWYGNDTAWRMVLDLNRILYYADAEGDLHSTPVRRFFSIVDGVIAGEGNGPLDARPKAAGVVLAGFNALAVDLVCAKLMGFDYQRMPMLRRAFDDSEFPVALFRYADIVVRSNAPEFDGGIEEVRRAQAEFAPHFGWAAHIERTG